MSAIKDHLQKALNFQALKKLRHLSASVTHHNELYESDAGLLFVKVADSAWLPHFEAEGKGLMAIAETNTIRVPKTYGWGLADDHSFLAVEYIHLHSLSAQKELGEQLARLHLAAGPETFGFECNNTIGATPQLNPWTENWIDFFREQRLRYQVKLTHDSEIIDLGEKLCERLPQYFEDIEVKPSLLHGDLWAGNAACDKSGNPVIFDPACYYGHHEADLGIMGMFGGFTEACYQAYHALIPKAEGFEERNRIYELYHHLNHFNIFGSGYRSGCIKLLKGP